MGPEALSVNESRETGMKQHLAKKERKNIYQLKKERNNFFHLACDVVTNKKKKNFLASDNLELISD
jgi:hypothetical protein